MAQCRNGGLGYNYAVCSSCQHVEWFGSSCGDRHCPMCLGARQARWAQKVCERLPDCPHFHLVFTMAPEMREFYRRNYEVATALFFAAMMATLKDYQKNNWGLQGGFLSVLHTWGSALTWHPHLHVLVSSGGACCKTGRWKQVRRNFGFPVKAMSKSFRREVVRRLEELDGESLDWPPRAETVEERYDWRVRLRLSKWVIFNRAALKKTRQVVRYLARYTSRIAISNQRVKEVDPEARTVRFDYKDYRDDGRIKEMTLRGGEFLRRFTQHLVPKGLRRIRSYGFLCGGSKAWREIPGAPQKPVGERAPEYARPACRHCGTQHWHYVICYGSALEEAPGLRMALSLDPTYCGSTDESCSLPASRAGPEGG